MGWRFRRSLRLAPGVRLNVTKTGVGLGFGGHGVRYSVHSSGRRTFSAGVPGSGWYWTETWSGPRNERPSPGGDPTDRLSVGTPPAATSRVVTTSDSTAGGGPSDQDSVVRTLAALASTVRGRLPATALQVTDAVETLDSALREGRADEVSAAATNLGSAVQSLSIWPVVEVCSLGAQPMPGFEMAVPLSADGVRVFVACYLLAHGYPDAVDGLLRGAADTDEALLVGMARRLHEGDPVGALAFGEPEPDTPIAWLAGLVRAHAFREVGRGDEADVLLDHLEAAAESCVVPPDAREHLSVLKGRRHLDRGDALAACMAAADVLAVDPTDIAATQLLVDAQRVLLPVDAHGQDTESREAEQDHRLRQVLASLEAEQRAAQQVLLDLVEQLGALADRQQKLLGWRRDRVASLRAQLATLVADISQDPHDSAVAAEASRLHAERKHAADQLGTGTDDDPRDADNDAPRASGEAQRDGGLGAGSGDQDRRAFKQLYRQLVKRWHPDLATDDEDERRRTAVTARITAWWRDGDFDALQRLWDEGMLPEEDAASTAHWSSERLAEAIATVRDELARTQAEVAALLDSDLERLSTEVEQARADGRDLLAEMAAALDDEIAQLEDAVADLQAGGAHALGVGGQA